MFHDGGYDALQTLTPQDSAVSVYNVQPACYRAVRSSSPGGSPRRPQPWLLVPPRGLRPCGGATGCRDAQSDSWRAERRSYPSPGDREWLDRLDRLDGADYVV